MNTMETETISLVVKKETPLKEMVIDYVGEALNPEEDEITVSQIVEVFAEEFPEFILAIAEENWINGYTQALQDLDFVNSSKKENETKL